MKQALLFVFLFIGGLLPAQTTQTTGHLKLLFDQDTPRRLVTLKAEYTEVTLCGLTEGATYDMASGYISGDNPCSFEMGTTQNAFARHMIFVADESCETFWFRRTCNEEVSAYLSLVCSSCKVKINTDIAEQGVVTSTYGGDFLALIKDNFIGGNCFDVSNVTFSGGASQVGTFSNGTDAMGISEGLMLSTGNVNLAQGPNNSVGASAVAGGGSSDADLSGLTGQSLQDVAVLEFDFIPTTDSINFDFVFGSEEYCEWVNTAYNDVFGFFISGPGITGTQNLAITPVTGQPITINSVNNTSNSAYFVPNSSSCGATSINNNIEYDGYTTVLTATAFIPDTNCVVYHLKLAIADGSDANLDSGVFLKKGSFYAGSDYEVTANDLISGTDMTVEGCGDAYFHFSLLEESKFPTVINFQVLGTATSGVDYAPLPTSITIPAEQKYVDLPVSIFADGIPEGDETIELLIDANVCSCLHPTIVLTITEPDPILLQPFDTIVCEGGGNVTLDPNASGGAPPLTYSWSPTGEVSSSISVPATTGSYSVTVSDGCGSSENATFNVTTAPAPTASILNDATICAGGFAEVYLSLTGTGPWDVEIYKDGFLWNTFTFTNPNASFSVNDVGTYTLSTVVANGCNGTTSGAANITLATLQSSSIQFDENCAGANDGAIEVTPDNPGSYTYTWSPTQPNSGVITDLAPGTYHLTLSDASGCTATQSYTIDAAIPLVVNSSSTGVDCLNPNDGTIDLTVSGGQPDYSYSWSVPANTSSLFGLEAGVYAYTVTDANGCEVMGDETVTEGAGIPVADVEPAGIVNCNFPTIILSGNGSSTDPGTTYSWTTTDGSIVSGEHTLNPVVDAGGTYQLVVTNSLGCTKDTTLTVQADLNQPIADVVALGQVDCNNPTLTLSDNGSSNGNDFSYAWTTTDGHILSGNTSLTPTVDAGGQYNLVVTDDSNGCTATVDVAVVADLNEPTVDAGAGGLVSCANPMLTLNGTGPNPANNYSYLWTTSTGNIISGSTSLSPVVDDAGTYELVITDNTNGCTGSATVDVQKNIETPIPDAGAGATLGCILTQVSLNGAVSPNNASFVWSTTNGNFVSGTTSLNPVVDGAGDYILTATHPISGCTAESTVTIDQNQEHPVADAGTSSNLTCATTQLNLDGSGSSQGGDFIYSWSTTDGNIASGETTIAPTIDQEGTYELLVTNTVNGCTASSDVSVLLDQQTSTPDAGPTSVLGCIQTTAVLSGAVTPANSSVVWTTTNGNIVSGNLTLNPTVDAPGDYTLVVTNPISGCTSEQSVSITANQVHPIADAGNTGLISCTNLSLILNGSGPSPSTDYTYQWSTTTGNIMSGETTLSPVVDKAGTYELVITDIANGCTGSSTVDVTENVETPVLDAGSGGTLGCSFTEVALNGSVLPSDASFIWSTTSGNFVSGETTLSPVVNGAGDYILTATHPVSGCTAESTVTITADQNVPDANAGTADDLTCSITELSLDGLGSSQGADFSYDWTTTDGNIVSGSTTLTPNINQAGTYELVVTNTTNGCSATSSVSVSLDEQTSIPDAGPTAEINCVQSTAVLSASVTPANSSLVWTSSNGNIVSGDTTLNPVVDAAGDYTLVATNPISGCTSESTVSVTSNQNYPTADAGTAADLTCAVTSLFLDASNSSQGTNFTYDWTTTDGHIESGGDGLNPEISTDGTYDLVVTDTTNGCTADASITVYENMQTPTTDAGPGSMIGCAQTSVTLSGSVMPSDASFTWTTINGNIVSDISTLNPVVNAAGDYVLVATHPVTGCTSESTVTITTDQNVPVAEIAPAAEVTCANPTILLDASGSSQGNNFSYQWTTTDGNLVSGTTGLSPTVNDGGTYQLVVTDTSNGCSATTTVVVNLDNQPPFAEAGVSGTINCNTSTLLLGPSTPSGNPDLSFAWSTSDGSIISSTDIENPEVNTQGTYTLLVTNNTNGCTAQDQVVIAEDTNHPILSISGDNEITCTATSASIVADVTATGTIDLDWTTNDGSILSGQGTKSIVVTQAGVYTLQASNADNGCSTIDSFEVFTNASLPTAIAASSNVLTCNVDTVLVSGVGSSSGANIVYSWSTVDGDIVSDADGLDILVTQPGTYTIGVTDVNNNCASTFSIEVDEDIQPPVVDAGDTQTLLCGVDSLQLSGSGSSTSGNVDYAWTTQTGNILSGDMTNSPFVNAAGTYYLEVTNNTNGCTAVDSVVVTQDVNIPIVDAGLDKTLDCQTQSVVLGTSNTSAGTNYTYLWTASGGGVLPSTSNEPFITVTEGGVYELEVVNTDNGCKAVSVVNVIKDDISPTIDVGQPSVLNCLLDTTVVGGSGTSTGAVFSYEWMTPNGHILSGANDIQAVVDAPGDYTLLVTNNSNFCVSQLNVSVTQDIEKPTVSTSSDEIITCTTPAVNLSGNGSSTGSEFVYLWTTSVGNILSGETGLTPQVNQPGFYTLKVTNTINGCQVLDSVEVIKDDSQPVAIVLQPSELTCSVHELQLDGSQSSTGSEFVYEWTTTNGNITGDASTLNPTINLPGDYHLVVTNTTNDCKSFSDVTVTENTTPPIAEAGANATLNCGVSSIALDGGASDVGASFKYQWTTNNGNILSDDKTLAPLVNQVGVYYLNVENTVNGCTALDSVVVVADVNAPTIIVTPPPLLTCEVTDVVIDASNSSNGSEILYSWATSNGQILNGAKTDKPHVGKKGSYILTLTNTSNGCTSTKEVEIKEDIESPNIDGMVNDVITCKTTSVDIHSSASGSGSSFDFSWTTNNGNILSGDLTSDLEVAAAGVYVVEVKDLSNGCTAEKPFVVEEDKEKPSINTETPDKITCKVQSVPLGVVGDNVTFNWVALSGNIVSGDNTPKPIVNQKGEYQVIGTDNNNGCTTTENVVVEADLALPLADAGEDKELPCVSNAISLGPVTPNSNYQYNWNTTTGKIVSGANSAQAFVSALGKYVLIVEDKSNGCTAEDEVLVVSPPQVLDLILDVKGASCTGVGGTIAIDSISGGTPPFLYSFDGGSSYSPVLIRANLESGVHKVIVQDVLGCEMETEVTVPEAIYPEVSATDRIYIEYGDNVQLNVSTSILPDDIDTIIWTPIDWLSCVDCLDPIAKPERSTIYDVLVVDREGCDASAKIAIDVKEPDVYIPNVFSPNSDNLENSSFYVHAKPGMVKEINTFFVVDRWGNMIYSKEHFLPNDPYSGWDGTFRGDELPPGVYVYHAVIEFVTGKKLPYSGDITVIR